MYIKDSSKSVDYRQGFSMGLHMNLSRDTSLPFELGLTKYPVLLQ